MPDDLKQNWKRPNGDYVLYINTPNAIDISKNAASEDTRKKILKYTNRAYPQNFKVLDSLLYYRQQYAVKLGYNSYAAYALTDKMAGNPESVWQFENNLVAKLTPHVTTDIATIRAIKHQMHPELPDTIYAWDVSYYKSNYWTRNIS